MEKRGREREKFHREKEREYFTERERKRGRQRHFADTNRLLEIIWLISNSTDCFNLTICFKAI